MTVQVKISLVVQLIGQIGAGKTRTVEGPGRTGCLKLTRLQNGQKAQEDPENLESSTHGFPAKGTKTKLNLKRPSEGWQPQNMVPKKPSFIHQNKVFNISKRKPFHGL
jgi:hypothetical protein